MAKKAKKFEMKRGDIVEALSDLVSKLEEVDTFESSPSDISNLIDEVRDELNQLASDVEAEAV